VKYRLFEEHERIVVSLKVTSPTELVEDESSDSINQFVIAQPSQEANYERGDGRYIKQTNVDDEEPKGQDDSSQGMRWTQEDEQGCYQEGPNP
jgi:hypothetical protein